MIWFGYLTPEHFEFDPSMNSAIIGSYARIVFDALG